MNDRDMATAKWPPPALKWAARIVPMIRPDLLEVLACPVCRKPLVLRGEESLKCNECNRVYPIRNGIPILLEPEATVEQL
jgi:LSD1 subclass zinc finger protein